MLRPWKLEIQVDHHCDKAIYLQIADVIIADIQSGRLKSGMVLPGSRTLARELSLNRNTIVEALQVLLNEEWLVAKERKGIFVATTLPVFRKNHNKILPVHIPPATDPVYRIRFDDGSPDSTIAPVAALARAYRQLFNRNARWQLMGYGNELGNMAFREAIAEMLNHQRGMQVNTPNICITRGSQMAMYLTAMVLFKKGDYVLVENPGYKPAWKAFENAGAKLLPVRVDEDGMLVQDVVKYLKKYPAIKALYTTPHHQYPTTVTLSLQRRLELVALSNAYGFTIIEDDYDNEFHFGYRPVLPVSSNAELKNYVYIGTMSKVVAPALRTGYLVGRNTNFIEKAGALRKIIDVQGDAIMEQAILQLIQEGAIKRHLKKATGYYKEKRDYAATLLTKYLGRKAGFSIPDGGLAFWLVPYRPVDWVQVEEKLKRKGITIILPGNYSYHKPVNGLRLGYANLSKDQLEEGIQELARVL